MTDQEWKELVEMREHIMSSGAVSAFDSAYMEHYAKLLAKSLHGKGDATISHKRTIAR
jgi:hypothetical protein